MRQRRIIALLAVLAAALAVPAVGTTAPGDQVRGPACGDITLSDPDRAGPPVYSSRFGAATVFALVSTAKPSCSGFLYTFSLYTDATQQTLITSQTSTGDGVTSQFSFTYSPPGAPSQVCIAATSSRDGHVIDAAPNSGCYILALDASPGGSGLN